jgi:hypothetical protein
MLGTPVFQKMLSSRFKERLCNHASQEKALVTLAEDNAEALFVVCNIIHHRNHQVPKNLAAGCVENLESYATSMIYIN